MFGLPADTVRKRFRTRIVRENSLNPVYGDEPFVFKKVVLPELACIRIAAYEENGKFLGHRVLPVVGLCPGYRHLTLRNELGQPVPLCTLFLCIIVKDYVPDGLSDFAEALANPIKYQSDLEKRSQQLAVLQEDMEPTEEDGTGNSEKCLNCKLLAVFNILLLQLQLAHSKRISSHLIPHQAALSTALLLESQIRFNQNPHRSNFRALPRTTRRVAVATQPFYRHLLSRRDLPPFHAFYLKLLQMKPMKLWLKRSRKFSSTRRFVKNAKLWRRKSGL